MRLAGIPTIVLSIVLKLAIAYAAFVCVFPLGMRFAESWMGVRPPVDGYGGAALFAAGVVSAFIASSALATRGAERERRVRACRATALVLTGAAVLLLAAWVGTVLLPSPYDAVLIDAQRYVKYPPFRATEELLGLFGSLGPLVLVLDCVITAWIVRDGTRSGAPRSGIRAVQ